MAQRASSSPQPLPSLSSSPIEEDISRAGQWNEDQEEGNAKLGPSFKRRGKERALDPEVLSGDEGKGESEELVDEHAENENGVAGYPPTKEQEDESRRVEENLRRWELNERQRRKAARESSSSLTQGSSIVADVTRKASLLWSGRRSKRPSDGGGQHHVLRSTDDGNAVVPLQEIDSPAPSPSPRLSNDTHNENPFTTPSASTTSLNIPQHSAIMSESSNSAGGEGRGSRSKAASSRGGGDNSSRLVVPKPRRAGTTPVPPPPPKPLDLPKPRTPPPRTETPHANRPPEPIPPPTTTPQHDDEEEVTRPTRWWTDWLCGCTESGHQQAGRTNPFE